MQYSAPITGAGIVRVPVYTEDFSSDPRRVYRELRDRYGALVPVELAPGTPATLVLGYREALRILIDETHYPADPRNWQQRAPAGCPMLPLLQWRPIPMRSAGEAHTRLRAACTAGLDRVDLYALRLVVERTAMATIETFQDAGSVEIIGQYAFPLAFRVLNEVLGVPPEPGQRALEGLAAVLDSADAKTAQRGNVVFEAVLADVVRHKRRYPGDDLISWLMAHEAHLDDSEMVQQTAMLYASGTEPTCGLIANVLLLLLTDTRFGGDVLGGAISIRDAIDEVLFADPPWANFSVRYPRQPQLLNEVWLPAHEPVVISSAACNDDPSIVGERMGNRSHLAWGAGPHACPAQPLAMLITHEAIDQLLDALPEIALAVPVDDLSWRPGSLHRMPAALPLGFPTEQA